MKLEYIFILFIVIRSCCAYSSPKNRSFKDFSISHLRGCSGNQKRHFKKKLNLETSLPLLNATDAEYSVFDDGLHIRKRRHMLHEISKLFKLEATQYDREMISLALPTLGAVLVDPCLSLVDTLYVGKLGAMSLGAVGPCTALFNFASTTASCILMVSTSVIIANYNARNCNEEIGCTFGISSLVGISLGTLGLVLFSVFPRFFLIAMGASDSLLSQAVPYLKWRALAMPASMFSLVAAGAYRGIGEPTETLRNGILVGLINVILDPFFMFSWKLGVSGAAIATAVAQWIGAASYAFKIFLRRNQFGLVKNKKLNQISQWGNTLLQILKEYIGASSSLLLRQIFNVGCWTLMASVATRMGVYDIAAHQLILSLWLIIAYAQDAIGVAGQVMIAQRLGSVKLNAASEETLQATLVARSVSKRILQLSFQAGLILAAVSRMVVPRIVTSVCSSLEVLNLVLRTYPAALLSFPLCCVVWTWDSLFYGASDFGYNARTMIVSSILASVGIFASLQFQTGVYGLWMNMTYGYFVTRLYFHFRRFNNCSGPFGESTSALQMKLRSLQHRE